MNLPSASLMIALAVLAPLSQDAGEVKPPPNPTQGPLCSKCKTTGKVENPFWKEFARIEQNAKFCSYLFDRDTTGYGLPWLPCKGCRNEPLRLAAEAEFKPLVAERVRWLKQQAIVPGLSFELAGMRGVDQKLGTDLLHIQSSNFLLSFEIDHLSVGQRQYPMHEAAHLYIDRLERLYRDFIDRFGLTDDGLNAAPKDQNRVLHWVLLFASNKPSVKAGPIYVGLQGIEGCKRLGRPSVFVTWWNKQKNPQDDDMHRYVIHHVSHMLLAVMGKGQFVWLGQLGAGWVEEGLGHFYEMEWFKSCHTHCSREANLLNDWIEGDWRGFLRESIVKKQAIQIAALEGKPSDVLDIFEHVYSWSFVDYLLKAEDPKKFPAFVNNLKQKWSLANSMRGVYGYNLTTFDDKWKDWVIKTYPK
ncbi:MAG: hypothetical protein U1E76_12325 [Planctomycetota bacterium]